ncbi:MAG: O-antigen ligase family protein [Candidatus Zixiibacteriota bacterium]
MIKQHEKLLKDFLFFFFALFVFGSTFSIALAQIALGVSLVLFLVFVYTTKYQPIIENLRLFYIFIGAYIFWMFLAGLFGDTPFKSILIMKEEWLFCIIPIGIYLMNRESYRQKLVVVFAAGVGLFALYGLLQFFTGVHWFKSVAPNPGPELFYVIKGNFPSPMTFGNYFGTAAGFFAGVLAIGWMEMSKPLRWFYWAACALAVAATLGSYNRGAILGLFVALALLGILFNKKKVLIGTGIAFLIGAAVVVNSPEAKYRLSAHLAKELNPQYEGGRVFIWNNALKIVSENPVFGVGQGNFRYEYEKLLPVDVEGIRKHVHAHNDFFNIAAIAGIPAALFFVGMWVTALSHFWRGFRQKKRFVGRRRHFVGALIGSTVFLVSSLTEATFADEEVRQMLMFIWAVGLWQWFEEKSTQDSAEPTPVSGGKTS